MNKHFELFKVFSNNNIYMQQNTMIKPIIDEGYFTYKLTQAVHVQVQTTTVIDDHLNNILRVWNLTSFYLQVSTKSLQQQNNVSYNYYSYKYTHPYKKNICPLS